MALPTPKKHCSGPGICAFEVQAVSGAPSPVGRIWDGVSTPVAQVRSHGKGFRHAPLLPGPTGQLRRGQQHLDLLIWSGSSAYPHSGLGAFVPLKASSPESFRPRPVDRLPFL